MGIILRLKLELEYCFVAFISKFVKQNSYKKAKTKLFKQSFDLIKYLIH